MDVVDSDEATWRRRCGCEGDGDGEDMGEGV